VCVVCVCVCGVCVCVVCVCVCVVCVCVCAGYERMILKVTNIYFF